jgi:hypothetical protein
LAIFAVLRAFTAKFAKNSQMALRKAECYFVFAIFALPWRSLPLKGFYREVREELAKGAKKSRTRFRSLRSLRCLGDLCG